MKEAIEKLMELMPEDLKKGLEITTTRVMKMNDQELNGLVMNREGVDTSPTIYIDHLYEKHLAGEDTKVMMMEVLDLYKDSLRDHPEIKTQNNNKGSSDKSGLYLRFKNQECNEFIRAKQVLNIFDGSTPVYFYFEDSKKLLRVPRNMWVDLNDVMIRELKRRIGDKNVALK